MSGPRAQIVALLTLALALAAGGCGFHMQGATALPQGRAVMQEALDIVVLALSPVVPHACHALWRELGHATAVVDERWPQVDAGALERETVEVVVQVNGKLRGRVTVPVGAGEDQVREAALADVNVQKFVEGKPVRKFVYVPGKLANLVV